MSRFLLCGWLLLILCAGGHVFGQPELPPDCRQLVVVTSASWDTQEATLCCLEKTPSGWRPALAAWPVIIGKNGLGWGRGLHAAGVGPVKKEGDRKAPAGLFTLEKRLYGYAEKAPMATKLAYLQTSKDWLWIDDPASGHYNRMVQKSITDCDWNSFEEMRRDDDLYKWMLVVEHNARPIVPGCGSCISIHLWHSPQTPTAGCTAMSEENLLRLIAWLDPRLNPLLLQLPQAVYDKWRGTLLLPDLTGIKH